MSNKQADVRSLSLSTEDKKYLKDLVQWSITAYFEGAHTLNKDDIPKPDNQLLTQELGAFVTLKKQGILRGCIGNVIGEGPLYVTVARMARAAAFEDPRFPLSQNLNSQISLLKFPSWDQSHCAQTLIKLK